MQTSLCGRCAAYLQKGGGRGCCFLLPARPAPLSTGGRRKTGRSFLRWKSSSRKTKKEEEHMHCEVPKEGDGLLDMDFPLEGKTSKPNYTATVGGALPLSIDAESHKSSAAGRFYLHRSEEGGVVPLPRVTTKWVCTRSRDHPPQMHLCVCYCCFFHYYFGWLPGVSPLPSNLHLPLTLSCSPSALLLHISCQ